MPYRKKENWFTPLYGRIKSIPWKGIFLILTGVLLLFLAIQSWLDGYASLNWKTTQGRITISKVDICHAKYSINTLYQATIVYEYAVDGVSYSSSKISFNFDQVSDLGCGNGEEAIKRYPL